MLLDFFYFQLKEFELVILCYENFHPKQPQSTIKLSAVKECGFKKPLRIIVMVTGLHLNTYI